MIRYQVLEVYELAALQDCLTLCLSCPSGAQAVWPMLSADDHHHHVSYLVTLHVRLHASHLVGYLVNLHVINGWTRTELQNVNFFTQIISVQLNLPQEKACKSRQVFDI